MKKRSPEGVALIQLSVAHGHDLARDGALGEEDRRLHIPAGVEVYLLVAQAWHGGDEIEDLAAQEGVVFLEVTAQLGGRAVLHAEAVIFFKYSEKEHAGRRLSCGNGNCCRKAHMPVFAHVGDKVRASEG